MNGMRQSAIRLFRFKEIAAKSLAFRSRHCFGQVWPIDGAFSAPTKYKSLGELLRQMKINKTTKCVHLAILMVAGALTAAAQGSSVPTGRTNNVLDWNESFEGSTGSSGQEMVFNSSATIHFGRY